MATKLIIILMLLHTSVCFGVGLQGDPGISASVDSSYISYYRDIAMNIIIAAFGIQAAALVIVVARNGTKAKKMTISLVISTAVTGIILSMI